MTVENKVVIVSDEIGILFRLKMEYYESSSLLSRKKADIFDIQVEYFKANLIFFSGLVTGYNVMAHQHQIIINAKYKTVFFV